MQFYGADLPLRRLAFRASTLVNVLCESSNLETRRVKLREADARRDKQIYANGPAFTARDPFAFAKCASHI